MRHAGARIPCVVGSAWATVSVPLSTLVDSGVARAAFSPVMGGAIAGWDRVDVLIVTAVKEEYDAVLAVHAGALPECAWTTRQEPSGLEVAYRRFGAKDGGDLRVAVLQSLGMGGVEAVSVAANFARDHEVRCLAMCGVCAGRRGKVALGDVIIADRMWTYDTGKRTVTKTVKGGRIERDQGDTEMYRIRPPAWKQAAERFVVDRQATWLAGRPRSYEAQGDWLLPRAARIMGSACSEGLGSSCRPPCRHRGTPCSRPSRRPSCWPGRRRSSSWQAWPSPA